MGPGRRASAGHDTGSFEGPLFAPRNAGADVKKARRLGLLGAAIGVAKERVAAVDQDVAGFESGL